MLLHTGVKWLTPDTKQHNGDQTHNIAKVTGHKAGNASADYPGYNVNPPWSDKKHPHDNFLHDITFNYSVIVKIQRFYNSWQCCYYVHSI